MIQEQDWTEQGVGFESKFSTGRWYLTLQQSFLCIFDKLCSYLSHIFGMPFSHPQLTLTLLCILRSNTQNMTNTYSDVVQVKWVISLDLSALLMMCKIYNQTSWPTLGTFCNFHKEQIVQTTIMTLSGTHCNYHDVKTLWPFSQKTTIPLRK